MKLLTLFLLSFFSISTLAAQTPVADSLLKLMGAEKIDSNKVRLMWQYADEINNSDPEKSILISQQAVYMARSIKYTEGLSRSLGVLANGFINIGNYPRALEYHLQKLKIEEKRNKPRNMGSVLINIGIVYVLEQEYQKAIFYYRKADSVITNNNVKDLVYQVKLNLGDAFDKLNVPDSAFYYYDLSLQRAEELNNIYFAGISKIGLGHYYRKKQNFDSSAANYRTAIAILTREHDDFLLCETTLGFAKLFKQNNQLDSAQHYAALSINVAKRGGFLSNELDAAEFLKNYYKEEKNIDSAFAYYSIVQTLNDSINSKTKVRDLQILSINEQTRQLQLEEDKRIAAKERSQQLQMLFIALFIPGFFILTLLLSRVRIPIRMVKILGVLSLLIFFEFLTLLLHPTVKEITHHTPVLEMLIFVAIASILIPLHHRVEHWLIEKLVQMREQVAGEKKIRIKSTRIKLKSNNQ
jgi:tetratricopeptide (TPR) repeat protein